MPWAPEQFSAGALAQIWEDQRRRGLELVPFFPGLMTGEVGALIGSFAGEPEVHHPILGRVKGVGAFERFVAETNDWLAERGAAVEDVDFTIADGRGVEELVLHLDGGRVDLPVSIATDHDARGAITELRVYFSAWPLTGAHAIRPPVLQPDPDLPEPAGADELRAYFSDRRGMTFACCTVTDAGRSCAVEYVAGAPPQAGIAVYVRGDGGRLAAVRVYDDVPWPTHEQEG
jgi:hypothetical protein